MRVLRCLTLNLWGAEEPLARRMEVVVEGLRSLAPDVVALQEVREIPGTLPNQAETLAAATGMHVVFAPAMPFGGGHEGLAVLSREPILEHAASELPHADANERRILLSARLSTGSWVHTTHLNYRLSHGKQREEQVQAIDTLVSAHPAESPSIIMGDFNARPESDEMRWMRGLTTLGGRRVHYQDAWERLFPAQPGLTWACSNPYTDRLSFLEPDRRIDYIYITPLRRDGRGRVHNCRIVFTEPAPDGVFASDHFGLLAEIQIDAT